MTDDEKPIFDLSGAKPITDPIPVLKQLVKEAIELAGTMLDAADRAEGALVDKFYGKADKSLKRASRELAALRTALKRPPKCP
jgi:hypothetical protein